MLLVKTKLGLSRIEGIGLFAAEPIRKGATIWQFHPVVDRRLTAEEIASLAEPCQEQIRKYTYREQQTGFYVLCGDDARFFNHAAEPNCDDEGDALTVAACDIAEGEELTCNYALFDQDMIEGRYSL